MEKRNSLIPSSPMILAAFICACIATGIKDARDKSRANSAAEDMAETAVETVLEEKVEVDPDLVDSVLAD